MITSARSSGGLGLKVDDSWDVSRLRDLDSIALHNLKRKSMVLLKFDNSRNNELEETLDYIGLSAIGDFVILNYEELKEYREHALFLINQCKEHILVLVADESDEDQLNQLVELVSQSIEGFESDNSVVTEKNSRPLRVVELDESNWRRTGSNGSLVYETEIGEYFSNQVIEGGIVASWSSTVFANQFIRFSSHEESGVRIFIGCIHPEYHLDEYSVAEAISFVDRIGVNVEFIRIETSDCAIIWQNNMWSFGNSKLRGTEISLIGNKASVENVILDILLQTATPEIYHNSIGIIGRVLDLGGEMSGKE